MNGTMKRIVAVGVAGAAVLAIGGSASAGHRRFSLESSDTGSATVQHVAWNQDSPMDPNGRRIKLAVAEQDGDDWAVVRPGTSVRGPVDGDWRFRFDVLTSSYIGAGAPRISVEVDTNKDGKADVYAYLSAAYCSTPIYSSDWATANFTAPGAGCEIYGSDGSHAISGSSSAWTNWANAHPGAQVLDAYIVMDEVGQSFIDRPKTRFVA